MPRPDDRPGSAPDVQVRCAACDRAVAPADTTTCAICRRAVCLACVRPYGHHMRACDDCRLAEW